MRVFVGVATGETQYVKSLRSTLNLERDPGDALFFTSEFSHGHVERAGLLSAFRRKTEYDAVLMLDADQRHPPDLLKRLRATMLAGDLDMVCAHYYRRQTSNIQSLCYELGDGQWPFLPMLDPPTEGVHEIGMTGLGCALIQRRVIEAVWQTLPKGDNPFGIGPLPDAGMDSAPFGSDFRFFILARRLGFRLWLDASVESPHAVTLWLGHASARKLSDYGAWADDAHDLFRERLRVHGVNAYTFKQRQRILEARKRAALETFEQAKRDGSDLAALQEITVALHVLDGKILECEAWIKELEKYPPIQNEAGLPTTANTPRHETIQDGVTPALAERQRQEQLRVNALDYVKDLPDVADVQ